MFKHVALLSNIYYTETDITSCKRSLPMSKKKITLDDIISEHSKLTYNQLYDFIIKNIDDGIYTPIKSSKLNGKKPALYNSYWLITEDTNYSYIYDELNYKMHPLLNTSYYIANPQQYIKDRDYVLKINNYLFSEEYNNSNSYITINERSFELFYREKFILKEGGQRILNRLGINLNTLNCQDTWEPMSYYSHSKESPQNILILENKDTFFSMRKHLTAGNNHILNTCIGTLVYGRGKDICKIFIDYAKGVEPYFNCSKNTILYFGDIDYEGILIYETFKKRYPDFSIQPFIAAYEKMIYKASKIGFKNLPKTKAGQNRNISDIFLSCFSIATQQKIINILENDLYIPQEILNINDL